MFEDDGKKPIFRSAPRREAEPLKPPDEPAPPALPPVRYPPNPSLWARLGRWAFDRVMRR